VSRQVHAAGRYAEKMPRAETTPRGAEPVLKVGWGFMACMPAVMAAEAEGRGAARQTQKARVTNRRVNPRQQPHARQRSRHVRSSCRSHALQRGRQAACSGWVVKKVVVSGGTHAAAIQSDSEQRRKMSR